jgi:hypothetical protein
MHCSSSGCSSKGILQARPHTRLLLLLLLLLLRTAGRGAWHANASSASSSCTADLPLCCWQQCTLAGLSDTAAAAKRLLRCSRA